jgi:hypothetical protein
MPGKKKEPDGTQEVGKNSALGSGDWTKDRLTEWTRRLNIWT